LSDRSAKETLLKQAKQHLEEAINSYPNSEQIATVKENLQTIDRELDQLRY
jgi:outer membrane protein assembly factor BamD (BamD/ComL family)